MYMDYKLALIEEEDFYIILTYEQNQQKPNLKICFPYTQKDRREQLDKALDFGEKMSSSLKIPLENQVQT